MKVLHINQSDVLGGAAIAGYRLHRGLLEQGVASRQLVGRKATADAEINQLSRRRLLDRGLVLAGQIAGLNYTLCRSGFNIADHDFFKSADILNLHNLHGGYLNYLALRRVLRDRPAVYTLHDMWGLTGHCTYSFSCERWRSGCGACPHPDTYPAIWVDNTRLEWKLKKRVFEDANLTVVAPSRWLAELASQSLLSQHDVRCIPNGIDTEVFRPHDKKTCRKLLGLPEDVNVVCFAAEHLAEPRKGAALLADALAALPGEYKDHLILLTFGHSGTGAGSVGIPMVELGYLHNDHLKALAYSAADLFVLPSVADNLPLVLQESMACGTPMVAFDAGGIPDLVRDGVTGLLATSGEAGDLMECIQRMLGDTGLREGMSRNCRAVAVEDFDLGIQVQRYLDLYRRMTG